ncbi:phosphoribosylpyrophosphate synthetase [Pelobium sp.]|nr:phosphoribosylpyrophosphate synthetase [Pelobium sp.]MDA9555001.1 phosphoribosylpyrophosphate synthetase [Pelobium sp.]
MKLHQENYETLSEAMNALKAKGFTYEFDVKETSLYHDNINISYKPHQLKVVEIHRFEGNTNPDDSSILYAIICDDGNKGLLIDAYGMYADTEKTNFMKAIEIVSE